MCKGFMKGYLYWIKYGEVEPKQYDFGYSTSEMAETDGSSHTNHDYNERYKDSIEYMVGDAILANQNVKDEEPSTCE